MELWRRTAIGGALRARAAALALGAAAIVVAGLLGAPARGEAIVWVNGVEFDLDKLYKITAPSFASTAQRLVSSTSPQKVGDDYVVRFLLYEPQIGARSAPNMPYFEKWVYKVRGRAQVYGNGSMWIPRTGDLNETYKSLHVATPKGEPRYVRLSFRVHASDVKNAGAKDAKKVGAKEEVTLRGTEELEVLLIEDKRDRSTRLALDTRTLRKHLKSLASNSVTDAGEAPAKPEPDKDEKGPAPEAKPPAPDAKPPGPEAKAPEEPASEVTLVRSFKADENSIVIQFRKKWSGAGDKVVDGAIYVAMDSTLGTSLYYDVPGKAGKKQRVQAALFFGGFKDQQR